MATDRGKEFARLVAVELVAEGKRRGITQKEIAEAAGVGEQQMSYYVHGQRGAMTTSALGAAAERLGVDPQQIVASAYKALLRQEGPATTAVVVDLSERRAKPVTRRAARRGPKDE